FRQQGLGFGHDHLYAYDADTLAARLTSAGFVDIAQRPYDPARDSRPYTVYVDTRKPGRPGGVRQTEGGKARPRRELRDNDTPRDALRPLHFPHRRPNTVAIIDPS